MEIRTLQSFLKVVEMKSFTRAADALGYAQSTITTHIQLLEDELGVTLFDKIGKKLILTPQAQELIIYANQIIMLTQQIETIGRTDSTELHGELRVGIVESILNSVFIPILNDFHKHYPNVLVKLTASITKDSFDKLRQNEFDIIYTMEGQLNSHDFVCVASHREHAVFAATPGHPLSGKEHVSLSELLDYPIIFNAENTMLQQKLNQLSTDIGKPLKGCIQCESSSTHIAMAERDMGIIFQGQYLLETSFESGRLCPIHVDDFDFTFNLSVYHHKGKWITPQMKGLIETTKQFWNIES